MASSHLFRLGPITGARGGVLAAMKHNKRTLQARRGAAAHIDASRTAWNYCLAGDDTPEAISTHAKVQMTKAGIDKPRKNGVMAIEVIFSLPADRHQQDTRPFFKDCFDWVQRHIAGELLAFDVHLDESAPHAHAVTLPLLDGKMQGSKIMGGKENITRLQNLFYAEVASRYGLSKSSDKRLSAATKATLTAEVRKRLKDDPVMKSVIWPWVRDSLDDNPVPCAEILGIERLEKRPARKAKSFVDHKRSRGKGRFET